MDSPTGKPLSRRIRLTVGAAVVLVVLGAAIAVVVASIGPRGQIETVSGVPEPQNSAAIVGEPPRGDEVGSGERTESSSLGSDAKTTVFVHILGEVIEPGLYELHDGDRAIDAVAAAGGLTEVADQTQLNLARFVSDGEQIIVPAVGEQPASPSEVPGQTPGAPGSKININAADAAALESLTGVGPALAGRIVDWRTENGNYASIEDLLNVSGIGEKTLDRFRGDITI